MSDQFKYLILKAAILKGLWEKAESRVVKDQVLVKFRDALKAIKDKGGVFSIKAGHPILEALNRLEKETVTSGSTAGSAHSPRYSDEEDKDKKPVTG